MAPARRTTLAAPLGRLRAACLAMPEAHEVEAWGEPTFRVRNKLFAMHASDSTHHGAGRNAAWVKATLFSQDQMIRAEPGRYFRPPYVGPKGWIGIFLDRRPPWRTIELLLADAYRLTAPQRLIRLLDER